MLSRRTPPSLWFGAALLALAFVASCLPEEYRRPGGTGDASDGSGGASAGGATASGGSSSGGSGTGGSAATGGAIASGGTNASGGTSGSTGGSSGGSAPTGGATSSGGAAASGGARASGGAQSSGGRAASGGASSTGGRAGSGGSSTGGASSGCQAGQLCENFESTNIDQLPQGWEKSAGAGTIGVVTGTVHGGSKSLKVTSPSGSYETYMVNRTVFNTMPKNGLYGRIFMRMNDRRQTTEANKIMHWTLVEARGSNSNARVRYGAIENGNTGTQKWLFNVETQEGDPHEAGIDDDGEDIQQDRWYCVEWMFDGTTDANEARLWTDGSEHPKMHATEANFFDQENGKYKMPDFDRLFIGWALYQPSNGPYEIFLDDLVIGPSKIGCN